MDTSPKLNLPYILPNQAQKHVTFNQAINGLDALVQLSVLSRNSGTPPASPQNGERHIVAVSATGAWAGQSDTVAAYQDGSWVFLAPQTGWMAWIEDESAFAVWSGSQWDLVQNDTDLQNVPMVGVNATADISNRFSLRSAASLLSHEGAGHQLKVNKNASADTASLLFQSGLTGYAEMGLAGDNHMHIKVSPDGAVWNEAIQIDNQTANVTVPCLRSGVVVIANDGAVSIPTPNAGGFVLITLIGDSFPQAPHSGILVYDTGPSLGLQSLILAAGMTNQGTSVLTGTSGPDAKTNLAVASGEIQIENRFGSTREYSYTFIG